MNNHTLHDVARLAGVSIGTVSNVINNSNKVSPKTIEKVQNAIRELNYIPNTLAKSLKTNSSRIIGVIAEDVDVFFSGNIIDGICEYCENHDYAIHLCNLRVNSKVIQESEFLYKELEESRPFQQSIKNSLNSLLASRVCGLIYIGTHPRDVGHILPSLSIPIVYAYAYTQKNDYCINYDDYQGARLAVEYLIGKGHKHIGLICGSVDSIPSRKRLLGYQSALEEHGLPLLPEYIQSGNWHYQDGCRSALALMALEHPPTAIFAMSDLMAVGAMNALLEHGYQIPTDISLHGFDNLELSHYLNPALTTIDLPLQEIGRTAALTMERLLSGNPPSQHEQLISCVHIPRCTVQKI